MKFLFTFLIAMLLITGCATPEPTAEPPAAVGETTITEAAAAPVETTAPMATEAPSPTAPPTPEPITDPYASRALTQNFTLALSDFFDADWVEADIRGLDYDPSNARIVLSGCVRVCDRYSDGYAYMLLLDAAQSQPPRALAIDRAVRISGADFTPDGKSILYSTRDGIMAYDLASDTSRLFYALTSTSYLPLNDISPDGRYLASDAGGTLVIIRMEDLQEVASFEGVRTRSYYYDYFNQASDRVVVARDIEYTTFAVYDIASQSMLIEYKATDRSEAALSPDGSTLAVASLSGGPIVLIDVPSGEVIQQLDSRMQRINTLVFSPVEGMLFVSGSPDDTASFYDSIRYFDPRTGEDKGSLLTYIDFYALNFSQDDRSLVVLSNSVGLIATETEAQRAAAELVRDFVDAIVSGDYQRAAAMTRLDDYAVMDVEDAGLNPDDLAAAFAALCSEDEVPCLPLGEIAAVNASDGVYWDYEVLVTLARPDRSIVMFDDIEPYEYIGVKLDEQGKLWIASLHPGMLYPFE